MSSMLGVGLVGRARHSRVVAWMVAAALLMAVVVVGVAPGRASADVGDIGYEGASFTGVSQPPTADKPQSKLWYAGGAWWAVMFVSPTQTWRIFRLDRTREQWVDTGVPVDNRVNTLPDALWNGSKLYIASHVVTLSTDANPVASKPASPARLYRYSLDAVAGIWSLDVGSPTLITNQSSESMTIDEDSTGTVWATWSQVAGSSTAGWTNSIYVNRTVDAAGTWGTPLVLPVAGSGAAPDDISAVVAFQKNKIGVLWSNQNDGTFYWAVHIDGQPAGAWRGSQAQRSPGIADDHMNVKSLSSDTSGRVYAAVKTSLNDTSTDKTAPQMLLLVFKPGTGSWSSSTINTVADCATRPAVMLDEENQVVHVVATAPSGTSCPFSGTAGAIYEKTASMDNPVFPAGKGTPIMKDASSDNINDVSTTKQGVTSATGLVYLASNKATKRYWHADLSLTTQPPPPPPAGTVAFHGSSSASAVATSVALPVPVGAAVGDVLVAGVSVRGGPAVTAPAGWTLVRQDVLSTTVRLATYTHVVGSGDPSSWTWSWGSSHTAVGMVGAYGGVRSVSPVDVSGGQVNATASTSVGLPSVTTTGSGEMLVGVATVPAAATFSPASGMSERGEIATPSATYKASMELSDQPWTAAGTTGARTATSSLSNVSIGHLLALSPS